MLHLHDELLEFLFGLVCRGVGGDEELSEEDVLRGAPHARVLKRAIEIDVDLTRDTEWSSGT
ncbi:MAG: hypothetical protein QXH90_07530 [Candidatus Korarchaeum sp.]